VALISKHLQPVAKDRLELKAMDAILPVHRAQILTYMRLTGCEIGLLANFNVERLAKGIERFVL
jgi:GxxExxY protein